MLIYPPQETFKIYWTSCKKFSTEKIICKGSKTAILQDSRQFLAKISSLSQSHGPILLQTNTPIWKQEALCCKFSRAYGNTDCESTPSSLLSPVSKQLIDQKQRGRVVRPYLILFSPGLTMKARYWMVSKQTSWKCGWQPSSLMNWR